MYSEKARHAPARRANDAFLRQMLGGLPDGGSGSAFPGEKSVDRSDGRSDASRPVLPENEPLRVPCNGAGTPSGNSAPQNGGSGCRMPSLAMVYAPKQRWEHLLDPAEGLCKGSIFADLILPLEVVPPADKEVGRRPSCGGKKREP